MRRVLVIEDDESLRDFISKIVKDLGHELLMPETFYDGSVSLKTDEIDLVIIEANPIQKSSFEPPWINDEDGGLSGRSLLKIIIPSILKITPTPEFIFITKAGFPAEGRYAIENGALDYIQIPCGYNDNGELLFYPEKIRERLSNVIKHGFRIIDGSFFDGLDLEGIIGQSWDIKRSILRLAQATKSDEHILITGETGTGKKLFARKIHENSSRKDGPFFIIDCNLIFESETERQLFDHNTMQDKIRDMAGGTLLLNEIDKLPLHQQAKFLRILQDQDLTNNTDTQVNHSLPRLISTTSSNLKDLLEKRNFMKDLFYEISTYKIDLPPLRNRKVDIPFIAKYHAKRINNRNKNKVKIDWSAEFEKVFQNYRWPGNILEMISALKVAISNADVDMTLDSFHLPPEIQANGVKTLLYDSIDINENSLKMILSVLNSKGVPLSEIDIQNLNGVRSANENQKTSGEAHLNDQDTSSGEQSSKVFVNSSEDVKQIFCFYEDADFWLVGLPGKEKPIKKTDGLSYIHFLLHYPNHYFKPGFVYNKGVSIITSDVLITPEQLENLNAFGLEKLDEKTRKAYNLLIEELNSKLESENFKDPLEALEIKNRIKKLTYALKKRVIRDHKSPEERARVNITKRIKNALKKIHAEIPEMKKYLNESTIKTGDDLSYRPLLDQTPEWTLHKDLPTRK